MSNMNGIGTLRQISTNPFSFDWDIDDYFKRPQKAYSHFYSPLFTFGEAIWRFKLYPNGFAEEIGWIEMLVEKVQSFEEVHDISFTVGVRNRHGDIVGFGEFFSDKFTGCWQLYHTEIIERSTVWNLKTCLVPNNVLTIAIEDFVLKNKPNLDCELQNKTIPTGIDILSENITNLLLNEEDCDVTFKVNGVEFRAHRCVLIARSPVFASMFRHQTSETITGIVEVPDCTPDAFKVLLLYLYSGAAENLSTCVVYDLYEAAVKYNLELLKTECVQFMKDDISPDTVCDTFDLSKKHKEYELLQFVTNYFDEHLLAVLLTIKWQLFLKEDPITANKLYVKAFQKKFLNSPIPKTIEFSL